MYLEWLQIGHLRNLAQTRVEPGPGVNVFTGPNASGKTALLEAIYILARARSFRTPRIREVVRKGEAALQVTAGMGYSSAELHFVTGIEKGRGQTLIRCNGYPVRTVSEQARQLPLVLVTPDSHRLITGPPKQRRHWLDWGMFHVEPGYLDVWRQYFQALRHRNSLLKERRVKGSTYFSWELTMAETGERIMQGRDQFIRDLTLALDEPPAWSVSGPRASLVLDPGCPTGKEEFMEFLSQCRAGDREAGFTRHGPHRADLGFEADKESVAAVFSRGQLKLFVCRLMMAEARVIEKQSGESPLFLLDDYVAELDADSSDSVLTALKEQGWQCFLTATEFRERRELNHGIRLFHVEHGQIAKVIK